MSSDSGIIPSLRSIDCAPDSPLLVQFRSLRPENEPFEGFGCCSRCSVLTMAGQNKKNSGVRVRVIRASFQSSTSVCCAKDPQIIMRFRPLGPENEPFEGFGCCSTRSVLTCSAGYAGWMASISHMLEPSLRVLWRGNMVDGLPRPASRPQMTRR